MIRTMYGNEVEISGLIDSKTGFVRCQRVSDGAIRDWHVSQLRADGGMKEIEDAADINWPKCRECGNRIKTGDFINEDGTWTCLSCFADSYSPEDHSDDICTCGDVDCSRPLGHAV